MLLGTNVAGIFASQPAANVDKVRVWPDVLGLSGAVQLTLRQDVIQSVSLSRHNRLAWHSLMKFLSRNGVPASHPLRQVRAMTDEALKALSPVFHEMYASLGRPSIAPEKLLSRLQLTAPGGSRRCDFSPLAATCT